MRDLRISFSCGRCGLHGETPEVSHTEGISLLLGRLEMRCPSCGSIISFPARLPDAIGLMVASIVHEQIASLRRAAILVRVMELVEDRLERIESADQFVRRLLEEEGPELTPPDRERLRDYLAQLLQSRKEAEEVRERHFGDLVQKT